MHRIDLGYEWRRARGWRPAPETFEVGEGTFYMAAYPSCPTLVARHVWGNFSTAVGSEDGWIFSAQALSSHTVRSRNGLTVREWS